MKELIVKSLVKETSLEEKEVENLLEIPPSPDLGDYAFPCFILSRKLKKSPNQIAQDLAKKLNTKALEKVEAKGPYVNFFLNRGKLAEQTLNEILKKKEKYGSSKIGKDRKIVIEFSSPNIAKPFGIGHLRSTIIGNSLANITSFLGYRPVKLNHLGDWGTPFGKVIAGYKHFGSEKELKKDPIKHLYDCYVKANKDESLDEEARNWFKKMESNDKEALSLWDRFRKLSLESFGKLYDLMNLQFDTISGESAYHGKMKKTVNLLKNKKLLEESEGAFIVNLEKDNLGVALIQKSDGATLYATRDITAAIDRHAKYKFEKMIYEVGSEQNLYFQQLFRVLELMGFSWAKDCIHVSHGLYLGEDSKKLATRKGKTIFLEEIIDETKRLAAKEIKKRDPKLSAKELERRSLKIALAAIFYGDLKNYRENSIIFNVEKFLSFEGNTGPYLLYTYARAKSILRKSKPTKKKLTINSLNNSEKNLISELSKFPEIVERAYKNLAPNLIANYSYQIAQQFNEFYHKNKIIGSENEQFGLALVESFSQVLQNALTLLGIDVLEQM
ncbi:MAG: arginine--tRNA ligase [archaeon]